MKCFIQTTRCWCHCSKATSIVSLAISARRARRWFFRCFWPAASRYCLLRCEEQGRRGVAGLLFCFLLVSVPYFSEQATNGYADVVVSFYFGAGSLYLYLWQTTGRDLFLVLSAFLTACAALTKNEGLVLIGIHLAWLAVVLLSRSGIANRRRLSSLGIYVCILAVVLMPWYRFQRLAGASERCDQQRGSRKWSSMG